LLLRLLSGLLLRSHSLLTFLCGRLRLSSIATIEGLRGLERLNDLSALSTLGVEVLGLADVLVPCVQVLVVEFLGSQIVAFL